MKPAIGPFLCVIHNFVCCRLLNAASGASVACVCAECCHVLGFPAELGYFNTVAAGCFSCPKGLSDPNNVIFSPWNANFTREPPSKCDWAGFGLVLSSNWAGFVAKTWQP